MGGQSRLSTIVSPVRFVTRPTRNLWPNADFSDSDTLAQWPNNWATVMHRLSPGWFGHRCGLFAEDTSGAWGFIKSRVEYVIEESTWYVISFLVKPVIPETLGITIEDQDDNNIKSTGQTLIGDQWERMSAGFQTGAGDTGIQVTATGFNGVDVSFSAFMLELGEGNQTPPTLWVPHIRQTILEPRSRIPSLIRRQYRYLRGRR